MQFPPKPITIKKLVCDPDYKDTYTMVLSPPAEVNGDHICAVNFAPNRANIQWWYLDNGSEVVITDSQSFLFTASGESYVLKAKVTADSGAIFKPMPYGVVPLYGPDWNTGDGIIIPIMDDQSESCCVYKLDGCLIAADLCGGAAPSPTTVMWLIAPEEGVLGDGARVDSAVLTVVVAGNVEVVPGVLVDTDHVLCAGASLPGRLFYFPLPGVVSTAVSLVLTLSDDVDTWGLTLLPVTTATCGPTEFHFPEAITATSCNYTVVPLSQGCPTPLQVTQYTRCGYASAYWVVTCPENTTAGQVTFTDNSTDLGTLASTQPICFSGVGYATGDTGCDTVVYDTAEYMHFFGPDSVALKTITLTISGQQVQYQVEANPCVIGCAREKYVLVDIGTGGVVPDICGPQSVATACDIARYISHVSSVPSGSACGPHFINTGDCGCGEDGTIYGSGPGAFIASTLLSPTLVNCPITGLPAQRVCFDIDITVTTPIGYARVYGTLHFGCATDGDCGPDNLSWEWQANTAPCGDNGPTVGGAYTATQNKSLACFTGKLQAELTCAMYRSRYAQGTCGLCFGYGTSYTVYPPTLQIRRIP